MVKINITVQIEIIQQFKQSSYKQISKNKQEQNLGKVSTDPLTLSLCDLCIEPVENLHTISQEV